MATVFRWRGQRDVRQRLLYGYRCHGHERICHRVDAQRSGHADQRERAQRDL